MTLWSWRVPRPASWRVRVASRRSRRRCARCWPRRGWRQARSLLDEGRPRGRNGPAALLPACDLARDARPLQVPSDLLRVRRAGRAPLRCAQRCRAGRLAIAPLQSLEFWHDLIDENDDLSGSWGIAIILMTFTVRLAILPLTFKGVKSMQRLQTLQPAIKQIQERYKDDKQRMNQEVMAFYQREKVNPLGSCFPLLLQIPFFISLFYLLRSDTFQRDIADNPGFLWIDNLAEKVTDPVLLGVLIVLYVATQLAASAVTAFSADPMQRRIMFALPFVFVIFIVNFEAGLILYWITTNVWTVGQQLLVKKLYPKPVLDAEADSDEAVSTPARGKPPSTVMAASDGGNGQDAKGSKDAKKDAKDTAKPAAKAEASAPGSTGGARTKAPPASPRKKKKRSGRRR